MKVYLIILFLITFFSCTKEPDCEITNPNGVNYKGCGDFRVFNKFSNDSIANGILHISMDNAYSKLTTEFQEFEIGTENNLWASLSIFNKPTESGNLFTDALVFDLEKIDEYYAISGTINAKIIRDKSNCDKSYVVDVFAENLVLKNNGGDSLNLEFTSFYKVMLNYNY